MPALPSGFVDIATATSTTGIKNVIGVAVDVLAKTKTSGSSYVVTFTLKDSELDIQPMNGLKIKYFNDLEDSIPDVRVRDVVLLRNVRVKYFRERHMGVVAQYDKVPWTIFRQGCSPIYSPNGIRPSPAERAYADLLLNQTSAVQSVQETPARGPQDNSAVIRSSAQKPARASARELVQIKHATPRTFVDLVCQIVNIWPSSGKCVLHVTDYTTNTRLLDRGNENGRDGDQYNYTMQSKKKWRGPSGQMTLQVALWEPHASFAREHLKENDIVLLTNVHVKLSPIDNRLEAAIHEDRHFPEKVHVRQVDAEDNPQALDLIRRKKEYWKKNPRDQDPDDSVEGDSGARKGSKSKKAEQQRKKKAEKREEGQNLLKISTVIQKRNQPNENVQAAHPAVPCRSLEDIIANESHDNVSPDGIKYRLPFQNICYRTTVRIVDFFPPELEDFAVPEDAEYAALSSDESEDSDDDDDRMSESSGRRVVWEWRFCLLVETAAAASPGQTKERMKLFVSGHDAVHLLKLDAADLRKDIGRLAELREKLFILWGDLEEQKKKAAADGNSTLSKLESVSSVPFTCCIKEYGVRCSHDSNDDEDKMKIDGVDCGHQNCFGWERRFAMFGTTIQS